MTVQLCDSRRPVRCLRPHNQHHERRRGCRREFSLDQLRNGLRAAGRRSTPRSRLTLRCASKPSRERELNFRRRTLMTLIAALIQLLSLATSYSFPLAVNPRASGLEKIREIVSTYVSEFHRILVPFRI